MVEINCWVRQGEKVIVRAPNPQPTQVKELRAALRAVRADTGGDPSVVFELPRPVGPTLRRAARVALGVGSVATTMLLLALVVVGPGMRSTVLAIVAGIAVVLGLFVLVVWRLDVGVTLHGDGRLRRSGWGGVTEVNVRDYQRVTVKVIRGSSDFSMVFGDD